MIHPQLSSIHSKVCFCSSDDCISHETWVANNQSSMRFCQCTHSRCIHRRHSRQVISCMLDGWAWSSIRLLSLVLVFLISFFQEIVFTHQTPLDHPSLPIMVFPELLFWVLQLTPSVNRMQYSAATHDDCCSTHATCITLSSGSLVYSRISFSFPLDWHTVWHSGPDRLPAPCASYEVWRVKSDCPFHCPKLYLPLSSCHFFPYCYCLLWRGLLILLVWTFGTFIPNLLQTYLFGAWRLRKGYMMDPLQVCPPSMATHTKSIVGGHWWAMENPITACDLKSV